MMSQLLTMMCNERTMVTKKGAADLDRWLNSGHQEPIFGFGSKTFPPKFQKNFRAVFFQSHVTAAVDRIPGKINCHLKIVRLHFKKISWQFFIFSVEVSVCFDKKLIP